MTDSRDQATTGGSSAASREAIEAIAGAFGRAWKEGSRPRIEDYLVQGEENRSWLVRRLLAAEVEHRLQAGEQPRAEEYVPRFASEADLICEVLRSTLHGTAETCALTVGTETTSTAPDSSGTAETCPPTSLPATPSDKPAPQPAVAPEGKRFGDYELLNEIARGGMGVVFKARQIKAKRIVALKMILAGQLADDSDVRRFQAEAGAAANLDHPHIVPVFDVGQVGGQHYFSMGFVDGPSLKQQLQAGPLGSQAAAKLMRRIAGAVAYAHSKGVIHRDLKPANVLMDQGENPRVSDFGLAKLLDDDSDLTGTGQIMGTPNYMPPEQAAGRTKDVGTSADIYSLGAILYEILTGRPPFVGASGVEVLRQVLDRDPEPPRAFNPSVDHDLETICLKCLEKKPEARYRTAAELIDDLDLYLANRPIAARPVTNVERGLRWCRRNPTVAALSLGVAALVIGVAVVSPLAYWHQKSLAAGLATALGEKSQALGEKTIALGEKTEALTLANQANRAAEEARKRETQERITAQLRLAENYVDRGIAACEEAEIDEGLHWMVRALAVLPEGEWDGLERAIRLNISAWKPRMHRLIAQHDLTADELLVTRDGRQFVAFDERAGTVVLLDAETGERSAAQPPAELRPVVAIALSAQDVLAIQLPTQIKFYDIPRRTMRQHTIAHTNKTVPMAFSYNGQFFACSDGDRAIGLFNLTTGEMVQQRKHDDPITALATSIDDRAVATITLAENGSYYEAKVHLWESQSETSVVLAQSVAGIAFSPDGQQLAIANHDLGYIRVWSVETKKQVREFKNPIWGNSAGRLVFDATGKSLLVHYQGFADLWDAENFQRRVPTLRQGWGLQATFSRRGDVVANCDDREFRLWDAGSLQQAGQTLRQGTQAAALRELGDSLVTSTDLNTTVWKTAKSPDPWVSVKDVRVSMYWTMVASGNVPVAIQLNRISPNQPAGLLNLADRSWVPLPEVNALSSFASPDGSHLIFMQPTTQSGPGGMVACDVAAGKLLGTCPASTGVAAISNRGQILYWDPRGRQLHLWEAAAEATEPLAEGTFPIALANTFAFVSINDQPDECGRFVDLASRRTIASIGSGGAPLRLAKLAGDETLLATVDENNVVAVWDAEGGEQVGRAITVPSCHSLDIHAGQRLVATGDAHGRVQVWDLETGRPVGPAITNRGDVRGLSFTQDGSFLYTGGGEYFSRRTIAPPEPGAAQALEKQLQVESGTRLDEDGVMRPVEPGVLAAALARVARPKPTPQSEESASSLRQFGAFGFPQERATVVCDTDELRVSTCVNREYFCLQAIVWNDHGPESGDGPAGDSSALEIDVDGDRKVTPNLDRGYTLNPLVKLRGFHYYVMLDELSMTGLQGNSTGKGSIRYAPDASGKRIRVDTYLIPWEELSRKPGDYVRFCYWSKSDPSRMPLHPTRLLNSVGYRLFMQHSSLQIPRALYHDLLVDGDEEIPIDELFGGGP